MKEATGELSMTAVTVTAIVAVMALVSVFIVPTIKNNLKKKTYCSSAFSCGACNDQKMICSYINEKDEQHSDLECPCDDDSKASKLESKSESKSE